ncbi:MAG: 30S ribosomal protein S3 [bacterium]|nr:30S ribosomal protein S3 [bacterium]
MGRKVHPKCFRLSTIQTWDSIWFAKKDFPQLLKEDHQIREFLDDKLKEASVDSVMIERSPQQVSITIFSGKPGFIIGRAGAGAEELKKKMMKKLFPGRRMVMNLNVKEVTKPSLSARIVAQQISAEIEKRLPFRRSMKGAVERVMKAGAEGVKISVSGRLNGAEIARTEKRAEGKVPLHNLRADINYAHITARTIFGAIGVNVWINRGEVFEVEEVKEEKS